ncbi:hypothetical protein C0J52_01988 [Blattella germanica]|nr:hypothetical protein C0J52_01988 [Blattella germanica]
MSDTTETILRHVGLIRLNGIRVEDGFRYLAPEVLMLITSIAVYVGCTKLSAESTRSRASSASAPSTAAILPPVSSTVAYRNRRKAFFITVGKCLALASLCLAGILRPSALNGVYFLAFLGGMTWWACYKELQRPFGVVLHCVQVVAALHIMALFLVQLQWVQEFLTTDCSICRLRHKLMNNPRMQEFSNAEWASYLNPVALLWLYYIMGIESYFLLRPRVSIPELLVTNYEADESAVNEHTHAWSITYHSWLTFVLLLWASILWILPNQRRSMMRCSPFLVLYAMFLLLAQYIYGMDLTNEELPDEVKGVNLKQIGFIKTKNLPCEPLFIKSLYTLFFWITLRQFMQERFERRNTSALEDMAAPLQISVGPATRGFTTTEGPKPPNQAMNWLGDFVNSLLTKFWIWVVAIMLFVIGLSGTRMTVYRIIYMALFLLFVLVFQLSYQAWRKFMYGFWLTVIIYSMSILVLIYTYQFDSFPSYWTDYLGISLELQKDIGMEKFQTSELFIKLLTPTFFLVITVIQMHYFHKDFLALTDIKCRSEILKRESKLSTKELQQLAVQLKIQVQKVIDLVWLFLELHMLKLMLLSIMLLCVFDVCAVHIVFMLLAVIALSFGSKTHTIVCHVVSVLVSILLLLKMIYQINYFVHETYQVNCTENHTTGNNADWVGLYKTSAELTLPEILKGYIGIIFLATLMAIVRVRQLYKRQLTGEGIARPHIMFPNIQRCHADQDLRTCFKYLLNYGFYKFGIEICLMATVALIGTRMDLYAVLYGIWLCVLVIMRREKLAKIWGIYQVFIVMLIPIQYAMAVGLPPGLCVTYPWDQATVLRSLQEWMFLPDPQYPPAAYKLVSWLDIAKRCFLSSFLWVTLAIVFLAGTNRVNLFSLGYLVGAFVFLWQGEEIYLRPVPYILKRWNTLLGYNVAIIMIKALLQIVGCMFLMEVKSHACWAAQLLGITCIRKFSSPSMSGVVDDLTKCDVPKENSGLIWDGVCFGCLIMMRRLFNSYYFIHQINENKAMTVLASRYVNSKQTTDLTKCDVPKENSGLIWDGVCFGCLIMMRRLFNSYYFIHQINENKAMTVLASRGAELIEELRMKRIQEQENQEHRILEKIRVKMERIKATQQKIQGPRFNEPESHHVELLSTAAPLAQSPSMSSPASPQGYHTPIDDDDDDDEDNVPPLTPRGAGSLLQAPTPSSAIMTVSLDGYLEPQRMSFSSPPTSELIPRAPSLEMDSFPVFSPPPYGAVVGRSAPSSSIATGHRRRSSIGPPWMPPLATPRPSVCLSSPQSHHTCNSLAHSQITAHSSCNVAALNVAGWQCSAIRSGDYYMFEELDDDVLEEKDETSSDDEGGRGDGERRVTLSKFLDTAFKTDMEQAAELALTKGTAEDAGDAGRRPSVVKLTRNKSSFFTAETEITPQAQQSSPSIRIRVSIGQKIWLMVKFAWAFVESAMVTLTRRLNHISRDYRYVMEVLTMEKKMLKEKPDFGQGVRVGSAMIWQPMPSTLERSKLRSGGAEDQADGAAEEPTEGSETEETSQQPPVSLEQMDETQELSAQDQAPIVRLVLALWFAVISHSDLVCYFMVFLYQIKSATILSLPLPLMVFLWGTLTIPRPTKTFWVTMIAYTEVIVIVKWMFQFEFLPWNKNEVVKNPFFPPRIIGIEAKPNYAMYDLFLLLIVFFHRYMLKSLGLWKTTYEDPVMFKEKEQKFKLDTSEGDTVGLRRVDEEDTLPADAAPPIGKEVATLRHGSSRLSYSAPGLGGSGSVSSSGLGRGAGLRRRSSAGNMSDQVVTQGGRRLSVYKGSRDQSEAGDQTRFGADEESASNLIVVRTDEEEPSDHIPGFVVLASKRYCDSVKVFFDHLLSRAQRVTADVYALIFLCDFFNFMVVIFGFASFGSDLGDGGVSAYLEENKVPIPFLVMLILQFALIVVDRALYLRKYILGKIIFQFLLVIGVHIWMFFILPLVTDKQFNAELPPQMWYMVKCFYLLLSAYQIRSGYPTRILGNVLCKRFMAVPFLFELRALMDWMWTDTSMTVWDWLKMEDIFANIFQHKCARRMESEYPQPRGEKKKPLVKYLMGGGGLFIIIAVIWFPLVIFALGSTVGQPNLPYDTTGEAIDQHEYELTAENPERHNLIKMLVNNTQLNAVILSIFPKFLKVTNRGKATPVTQLMRRIGPPEDTAFRNMTLRYNGVNRSSSQSWWSLTELCNDTNYDDYLKKIDEDGCNDLLMYTFNDKSFPKTLSFISGEGIIGMYTTMVLIVSNIVRGYFAGIFNTIMYDDMPNVDRVLQLCLDIYLVRESGELDLEEDLFAKLVFLYRSPETLIKWTRPREEGEPEEGNGQPAIQQ